MATEGLGAGESPIWANTFPADPASLPWIDTLRVSDQALGDMIRKPDKKQPFSPLEPLPGPPTQPGWYWWKSDAQSQEIMVQVRLVDGQLKMHLYFRDDVPVADAKGYWRGPIPPSTGPGSR